MRVVIAIIALVLFVLLARFVYVKVRESQAPELNTNTILPVPSPSYFPAFSPTLTPSPTATSSGTSKVLGKTAPKATPKATARPIATTSGGLGKLPTTGGNELAYILSAAVVGGVGLALRKARA